LKLGIGAVAIHSRIRKSKSSGNTVGNALKVANKKALTCSFALRYELSGLQSGITRTPPIIDIEVKAQM
jgi:hypothetical protein